ncbi:transaldolase [filamentous cyanobacterium LEGE 11480]|uniref:Transaldolase n=1 Tax=Romeriopsis navalis LEGE 11480 TaxID=2777977 RepID=A0A928VUR9_9CYAN|nr:transaldolase [Romeriopsis navalis]MBE9032950.1 transaldolase [Romeriopsis navalis LEGE 11480]
MTTATLNHIQEIAQLGQSIWMDNLTRNLVQSGELQQMIETRGLLGVTSNPAIFEKAIVGNEIYDADIEAGIKAGKSLIDIYESLIFEDITGACDVFMPVYEKSNGLDGYISIEVPPTLARNTEDTIRESRRYYNAINHANVMIKIPGTPEGLPAVKQMISEGINVNVTLLFSVQSYIDTAWAYIEGLEAFAASGGDVSKVSSVASFFLSRIDIAIDGQLKALLETEGLSESTRSKLEGLKGQIAIANAKRAYQEYKKILQSDRWQALAAKGAQPQRLLWASTGTKDPNYSDVMYVDELVGNETVNTLPPKTIEACFDHCDVAPRIESNIDEANKLVESLGDDDVNIDLDRVMEELLADGIAKFVKPFETLMAALQAKVDKLSAVAS